MPAVSVAQRELPIPVSAAGPSGKRLNPVSVAPRELLTAGSVAGPSGNC